MEKVRSFEMDLEEWEWLPDDGLISSKSLLPSKEKMPFNPKGVVHMDYFNCPSHPSHLLLESMEDLTKKSKREIMTPPAHIKATDEEEEEELVKDIKEVLMPEDRGVLHKELLKESKETEFADMKTEGEKKIQYDDEHKKSCKEVGEMEEGGEEKGKGCCWDGFGFSIWRWRLKGIGALCSIGVAAATICIFILGSQNRQKQHHQNQKLQFQIYTDDKNIKQMVHHATRLNQAISAARGVPVTRANISFGGYYDGF